MSGEMGLTGQLSQHACDTVTKALSVAHLSDIKFGDYQALLNFGPGKVPDIIMLSVLEATASWSGN